VIRGHPVVELNGRCGTVIANNPLGNECAVALDDGVSVLIPRDFLRTSPAPSGYGSNGPPPPYAQHSDSDRDSAELHREDPLHPARHPRGHPEEIRPITG
jgi:hypothetical protein